MMKPTRLGSDRSLRIAHQVDGEDSRSVHVDLIPDGTLDLSGHDTGPSVQQAWDADVFECGIVFAPADMPGLAFALVAEHYTGDLDAVDKITKLARRHGIEAKTWDWAR